MSTQLMSPVVSSSMTTPTPAIIESSNASNRATPACQKGHTSACEALRKQLEGSANAGVFVNGHGGTICAGAIRELMLDAKVSVPLRIESATIAGSIDFALMDCKRALQLRRCTIDGDIAWQQATLHSALLESCTVRGSIQAEQLRCAGTMCFEELTLDGAVDIRGAVIGGNFNCEGAHLGCAKQADSLPGLMADGLRCEGSLLLGPSRKNPKRVFESQHGARLVGARIGGTLDLRRAQLGVVSPSIEPPNDDELDLVKTSEERDPNLSDVFCADLLNCECSVLLNEMQAHGHVRLLGARIQGQLLGHKSVVDGWFLAAALECRDIVWLSDVTMRQGLSFAGARVDQRLEISGESVITALRLNGAKVGNYVDNLASRPAAGHLMLDGFVYDTIGDRDYGKDGDEEKEFEARMTWIRSQSEKDPKESWRDWIGGSDYPYKPAPYTVFADFLDRRGRPHLAGKTRIERESRRARRKELFEPRRWALWCLWQVRFGYLPQRALPSLLLMPVLLIACDRIAATTGPKWSAYWSTLALVSAYTDAAKRLVPLSSAHDRSLGEVAVSILTVCILSVGGAGALRVLARK